MRPDFFLLDIKFKSRGALLWFPNEAKYLNLKIAVCIDILGVPSFFLEQAYCEIDSRLLLRKYNVSIDPCIDYAHMGRPYELIHYNESLDRVAYHNDNAQDRKESTNVRLERALSIDLES